MIDVGYVSSNMLPEQAPPSSTVGPIKWIRENLFNGVVNSILTLLSLYFIWYVLSGLLPWIWYGSWTASSLKDCREVIAAAAEDHAGGHGAACWAVIR